MTTATLWACVILAGSLQLASGNDQPSLGLPDPNPLFLTPYINACMYGDAKNKSFVDIFKMYDPNASAYSGYITVNETANSSLFFLFVEAQENRSSAPLMLWTPGGPGLSAIFSLLLQNGPLAFNGTPYLSPRELTIQRSMSVIYLDAPVGAGFSFTSTAYPKVLDDVTRDIIAFLTQFLQLFGEYKDREFYAGGDSYGARYSVALAHEMLRNPRPELPLNFQGVIGGNGFLGPIYQIADSSDFL
uniref:Putative serine carboxypeptidase n=1 Tax=Amblyomma americanum TaxID=6943 RepID=A0A0C9S5F8_AMBAM